MASNLPMASNLFMETQVLKDMHKTNQQVCLLVTHNPILLNQELLLLMETPQAINHNKDTLPEPLHPTPALPLHLILVLLPLQVTNRNKDTLLELLLPTLVRNLLALLVVTPALLLPTLALLLTLVLCMPLLL